RMVSEQSEGRLASAHARRNGDSAPLNWLDRPVLELAWVTVRDPARRIAAMVLAVPSSSASFSPLQLQFRPDVCKRWGRARRTMVLSETRPRGPA
ncbi:MAG: hypothetical protein ABR543_04280, partial [Gemmatimonadaceae bacterium]